MTRLEAFRAEVEAHRERPAPSAPERKTRRAAAPAKNRGQAAPTPGPAARGKLYIPDFADHAFAYAGALRYAVFDAEVLPPPDNEVRRKGERFSSGRECHPYSILAGDLVQLAESLPPKGPPAIFFYPGTFIPCLMSQYGPGHRLILDQLGDVRLEVLTPDSNELYELLGLQGGVRLWRGLTAIDTLVKLACEMRPYEKSKGMVDAIHRVNCLDIARAVENGDIVGVAGACVERFSSAAIDTEAWQKRELPVVGIAGDMYTRSNTFANQNLFHKLEAAGCEVWPSPFMIDIFDFGLKTAVARSLYRRDMQGFLRMGSWLLLKEMSEQGVKKLLSRRVKRFAEPGAEPGYEEMRAVAAPYVGERAMEVISVNIAKMSDFASKGADGIINAMCFNCMVGNVSSAITGKLRREHDDIPIVNLVFGASEGASQSLRLEAFLHQVKAYAARRRAAPSAPLAVLPV
ncbi:MAG: hypothetical protein NTX64_11845 [Elusimicrobia bacterium]|nr:hypothetical protein [Elusimicrobiota bacterium]